MKTKYLSHAQACAMCRDFQHLRGQKLDDKHAIDVVTVVPYSHILQWKHLSTLLYEGKTEMLKNPSGRYDVAVAARTDEEPGFIVQDLRSYLKSVSLPFEESRYSCLRNNSIPMATLRDILG